MKWYLLAIAAVVVGLMFWQMNDTALGQDDSPPLDEPVEAAPDAPEDPAAPKSTIEKVSYGIGLDFGRDLRQSAMGFDVELVLRGVSDGMKDARPMLTREQLTAALADFRQQQMRARATQLKKNLETGQAFLSENGKKEGVITLPSGLQYEVVKQGDGESPTVDQHAKVNYRGTLLDGTEFDSSERNGGPQSIPVGAVIPGWQEALLKMKAGDKWRLFIPSELAYGDEGAGPDIPPGATLIFDVELLGVETPRDLSEMLRQFQEQHGIAPADDGNDAAPAE